MKKVLMILPALSTGGAENMVYELVKNLDDKHYEPFVLCYGSKTGTHIEKLMEQICKVQYANVCGHINLFSLLKVCRKICKIKPDIIHAHMGGAVFAIIWSLFFKTPVVLTVHTKPEKAFSKSSEKVIRKFFQKDRFRIVAVSAENAHYVQAYFGIKSDYVNNGIDIHQYAPKKHKNFTYINVARQDENKNQLSIIRAFEKIHSEYVNDKLILVGDGPTHLMLKKEVYNRKLEENVVLTGQVANPKYYYNESDVYIQSSHREALPLSILEAMAAGLPIISTNVGGICDVVSTNGLLINDNEEEALYKAMIKIRTLEKQELLEMKNSSLSKVKEYSADKMSLKYSKIYDELIGD